MRIDRVRLVGLASKTLDSHCAKWVNMRWYKPPYSSAYGPVCDSMRNGYGKNMR